mmetsp:Transcript_21431/g.50749  ORF Transcript_21431/g.50749 Transcript_21431/m.50749 type:complete len:129 (+) Transcript_21431:154-540(+)
MLCYGMVWYAIVCSVTPQRHPIDAPRIDIMASNGARTFRTHHSNNNETSKKAKWHTTQDNGGLHCTNPSPSHQSTTKSILPPLKKRITKNVNIKRCKKETPRTRIARGMCHCSTVLPSSSPCSRRSAT